jgi:hypothetical protein
MNFVYRYYPSEKHFTFLALNKVRELKGATIKPEGGGLFNIITIIFGWKISLWLKYLIKNNRYKYPGLNN